MKAQELRIGNYVNRIVTPSMQNGRIKPSIDLWRIECTDFCSFENFEPIPLTEQWLIDFGLSGRLGEVSDTYHIGINPVTHDWLFDIVWIHGTDYPFYRNGRFMIKHVHQLQNLYFSLTGEELQL